MAGKNRPLLTALGLFICDTVIEDKITNKNSLIGLFNSIHSNEFPFIHPVINVYVSLTGGHGKYQCSLSCVKADTDKPIWSSGGQISMADPLAVFEINFELRNVSFPAAGIYNFQFLCDNEPIISRKFQVLKRR